VVYRNFLNYCSRVVVSSEYRILDHSEAQITNTVKAMNTFNGKGHLLDQHRWP